MKVLAGVLLFLATTGIAPLATAEGFERQHESHAHGIASMRVVLEGGELQIQLDSPAANIVGFEHQPANEQQQQDIINAIVQLEKPQQFLHLPEKAGCQLEQSNVAQTLIAEKDSEHQSGHQHDEDHHEDEHNHEAEHRHEDEHQHVEESDHREFELSYHYHCQHPEALDGFTVEIFRYYPRLEKLEIQLIGPGGQGYQQLDANNTYVRF